MHNAISPEISYKSFPDYKSTTGYLRKQIASYVTAQSRVLDAGCGEYNRLLDKSSIEKLIGCDIDSSAIRNNKDISEGIVADLENLTLSENDFDLVMSYDVIEHLDNPERFVESAARMLKRDGHIFVITPNRNSLFGFVAWLIPYTIKKIILKILGISSKNTIHRYRLNTIASIATCLETCGFGNIQITVMNNLPSSKRLRQLFFPYYILCKFPFFRRFGASLFFVATKR